MNTWYPAPVPTKTRSVQALLRPTITTLVRALTRDGDRPSLASLEALVFQMTVDELRANGVSHQVISDMFGLTLRGYYAKLSRTRNATIRSSSVLREAILEFLARRPKTRAEVADRFQRINPTVVSGILDDLEGVGTIERLNGSDVDRFRLTTPMSIALTASAMDCRR